MQLPVAGPLHRLSRFTRDFRWHSTISARIPRGRILADCVRTAELVRDEPSAGKLRWIRPVSTSATSGSIPRLIPPRRWERSATVQLKVQFADQDTEMWI